MHFCNQVKCSRDEIHSGFFITPRPSSSFYLRERIYCPRTFGKSILRAFVAVNAMESVGGEGKKTGEIFYVVIKKFGSIVTMRTSKGVFVKRCGFYVR